jgi:hypothetical protein
VDDVLGEVVVAAGDEDLGALDLVGAVRLLAGLGPRGAHVAAGVGFGEAHGAAPGAVDQPGDVALGLLRSGAALQHLRDPQRQARVAVERGIGAGDQLVQHHVQHPGRALAAVLRPRGDALHPQLIQLGPGVPEARRRPHRTALQPAPLAVRHRAERAGDLGGEAVALLDDRLRLLHPPVLELTLPGDVAEAELLVEDEEQLPEIGPVAVDGRGHSRALLCGARRGKSKSEPRPIERSTGSDAAG